MVDSINIFLLSKSIFFRYDLIIEVTTISLLKFSVEFPQILKVKERVLFTLSDAVNRVKSIAVSLVTLY